MHTTTVTQKGQVTIPISIRKALRVKPGQKVSFEKKKEQIIIKSAIDFFSLKESIKTKRPFDIKAMDKAAEKLVITENAKKQTKNNRY
ncbi:hypothetical protein A2164_04605 [Candidatus Curtissbacteria bacterium RBG_13_35_7]|uniref:SpoVT-AbrB domain-containing protein n=1 Tax=Candidatus Curtissbacteria bacterium RBG_13_35_7 TaxID=1797705 RepID=A0A1F5G0E2_9BACT|nr:MAG: hypothetical protein A2164_04605 [Candidatus Curtissbacteria bacterium RBG_13_35_7]